LTSNPFPAIFKKPELREVKVATTAVVHGPSTKLHVRGMWSARDDRTASAVWLGILWVGMIAGFGVDFPRYLHENPPAPVVAHVHGAVFSVWMLLLTAQVMLVLRDRIAWHRKLGWFMAGWACLMAVMGPWAAMASQVVNLHSSSLDPQFFSVNIVDIAGFFILLGWGITLRKNPAAHRRMTILATVSLADPGFARFSEWVIPTEPASVLPWFFYVFYGNVLLIVLMAAWDWWRGRLMRSFVIGAVALLTGECVASVLYFWGPWKTLTLSWVVACAGHFS
jgi:hypothetical protein